MVGLDFEELDQILEEQLEEIQDGPGGIFDLEEFVEGLEDFQEHFAIMIEFIAVDTGRIDHQGNTWAYQYNFYQIRDVKLKCELKAIDVTLLEEKVCNYIGQVKTDEDDHSPYFLDIQFSLADFATEMNAALDKITTFLKLNDEKIISLLDETQVTEELINIDLKYKEQRSHLERELVRIQAELDGISYNIRSEREKVEKLFLYNLNELFS
ncbi:MAG: hypothetical protein INQ03_02325 [Candidatus Heimdallarchaeota archaeon]|nr:hypothetical protein [Candidatus Heimdallarchaeota archaeon]